MAVPLPLPLLAAALLVALVAATPLPQCNKTGQPNPINLTRCGASGCADLPQCSSITPGAVCIQNCTFPPFPPSEKALWAWVGGDVDNQQNRDSLGGMAAVVQQLQTNP